MLEFDKKKVVGTATIQIEITEDEICNIIVGAFEGGSNYWMGLDTISEDMQAKPKDEPWSTWCTKLLVEGKGVKVYDREETEEDSNWIITLDKLIAGYALNCQKRPHDCDMDQADAGTYDCILQYALFGKLVFG